MPQIHYTVMTSDNVSRVQIAEIIGQLWCGSGREWRVVGGDRTACTVQLLAAEHPSHDSTIFTGLI